MLGKIDPMPFPRAIRLLGLTIIFVTALAMFANAFHPRLTDFLSFWAAGKLSLSGNPLAAYDIAAHKAVQLEVVRFTKLMPFPYPPPFLLLVTPLALLPYGLSAMVWVAGTFALYVAAAQRTSPSAGWTAAAFPPVLVNGIIGQNGLLTGAIFIWGMNLLKTRPIAAGALLGCLIIKPQLGVLLPVAFLAASNWRAFAGAAASSLGLLGTALLAFGPASYSALAKMMPLYGSIAADGLVGWHKMASVYATMRLMGADAPLAWSLHITVAAGAAAMVWQVWRSDADLGAKAAVLACASVLVSPYIYLYDTALLLLPLLWLARNGENAKSLAALWCIPLIGALQNWGLNQLINPAPLLPIALLALIARRRRKQANNDSEIEVVAGPQATAVA